MKKPCECGACKSIRAKLERVRAERDKLDAKIRRMEQELDKYACLSIGYRGTGSDLPALAGVCPPSTDYQVISALRQARADGSVEGPAPNDLYVLAKARAVKILAGDNGDE